MANLDISDQILERLRRVAQNEHRSVESVLETMIAEYETAKSQPRTGIQDADIDVPADIEDQVAYRDAIRQIRPKLYQIARRYWLSVGDKERLALSDEDLDKQFWLIDPDGISRLKSDQGKITLPPDPLEALIGLVDDAPIDLSSSVRAIMGARYRAVIARS